LRKVLAAVIVASVSACTSGPGAPVSTLSREASIAAEREAKDRMFRTSRESPLLPEARATFTSLPYYPVDLSYRVPASLNQDRAMTGLVIELQTSTNQRRRMRRVGTLGFSLQGVARELTAFADADTNTMERLFVPFADLTSGEDTYKGGRYLDLDRTATGVYDLDFNLAYHPYCVFNPSYDCPVPPRENRLPVAIRAGEKLR
jgi:uncharacterized protein